MAPDYLFARCGLARCLAQEGNLSEARALLDGLIEIEEWHRSAYRSLLLTQRALALASGKHEAARNLQASMSGCRINLSPGQQAVCVVFDVAQRGLPCDAHNRLVT